jgi:hypothetical protein
MSQLFHQCAAATGPVKHYFSLSREADKLYGLVTLGLYYKNVTAVIYLFT